MRSYRISLAAALAAVVLTACGTAEADKQTKEAAAAADTAQADKTALQSSGEKTIELSPEAVRNQAIQVATVSRRRVSERKVFPASVEEAATRSGTVSMPVGSRVQQINVDIGDSVRRGQVLAVLTSSELGGAKADLLSAKASLLASQARLIAAKRQSDRETYLAGRGISSQREQQEAQAQLASAQSEFAGAQSAIEAAKARLLAFGLTEEEINRLQRGNDITPRLSARSSVNGQVILRKARVGQVVQPGEALFTISDLSEVWWCSRSSSRNSAACTWATASASPCADSAIPRCRGGWCASARRSTPDPRRRCARGHPQPRSQAQARYARAGRSRPGRLQPRGTGRPG